MVVNNVNMDKLFAQECKFIAGANNYNAIPSLSIPEVAFLGRSNVGKSSLLNALLNRNNLARVSRTPGRTQQLNFFSLKDQIILVDLPGYGYAKVSKNLTKGWNKLTLCYFRERSNLKRVYILVDARHSLKEIDIEVMRTLDEYGISYQLVFTKLDKANSTEIEKVKKNIQIIISLHPALYPEIIMTSARKRLGLSELRTAIATAANIQA